jgi:hypothetical protein
LRWQGEKKTAPHMIEVYASKFDADATNIKGQIDELLLH